VLVYVRGYSFETTLGALVLAGVVLVLLINLVLWLLRVLNPFNLRRVGFIQRWLSGRDPVGATERAIQDLLLGHWQKAYRALVENADSVQIPSSNYLAASLAAFQMGDRAAWSYCLERAEKKAGNNAQGVRSLRALLETRSGQREQGLVTLQSLQRLTPNQPFVLAQLKDSYRALGDWNNLAAILPELAKQHVVAAEELLALQTWVYQQQLAQAGSEGLESLHHTWKELPKALRSHAPILAIYLQELLQLGEDAEAAGLLTAFLKKDWSDELVTIVGHIDTGKPRQQLDLLENCLKQHPNNPTLLFTLGRVSLRNQLWGKGRAYLEQAANLARSVQQNAQINAELGRLLEQLGEREQSFQCYQKALKLLE
jgi:HemY protein